MFKNYKCIMGDYIRKGGAKNNVGGEMLEGDILENIFRRISL